MMKRLFLLALVALANASCEQKVPSTAIAKNKSVASSTQPREITTHSQSAPSDIRKSRWGDSLQAVMRSEAGEPQIDGNRLIYESKVGSLSAALVFDFTQDKLTTVYYLFDERHTNNNLYLADFDQISKLLKEKYREPSRDENRWSNDLFKDDASNHGDAVAIGHLTRFNTWSTERTQIFHVLSGDNFKISHSLQYSSVELADTVREKQRAEDKDAI